MASLNNNFRKTLWSMFVCILLVSLSTFSFPSCKTKEGGGYEEKMAPKTDKYGRLSTKKGKTRLFK